MTATPPAPSRITDRICRAIVEQIASGALAPRARVPSTRVLAAEWGVSRTTATAAYDQLIAQGYLQTRQGAATRVAPGIAPAAARPAPEEPAPVPSAALSAYGRRLAALTPAPERDREGLAFDFRYGDLADADFPRLAWRKAVGAALLRRRPRLRYGDPAGSARLRAALKGYLWRARGLRCEPEQIVVVNGSQQGIDLCARLLVDPGSPVLMENPGYVLARQAFLAAGAQVIPVGVDEDGLRTQGLPHDPPSPRLVYTTPSHQYPLGGVLPVARRRELLEWAARTGAVIVEDDYDSEYRFDIAPVPTMQGLEQSTAGGGRVVYVGTVSKTLSPTLRLGWLVLPPALAPLFAEAKRLVDRHTPALEQEALAELIESGAYERHVRRVRRTNGARRAALLAALAESFGAEVRVAGAKAGLHVVAWLDALPRAREQELVARAYAAGLGLYPVGPLYAPDDPATSPPPCVGLVMGYAGLDEAAIRRGVGVLKRVVDALR